MATLGDLQVVIKADVSDFQSGIRRAEGSVDGFSSKLPQIASGAAAIVTALGAAAIGAIKSAGEAEKAAVSFKVMLGSAAAAKKTVAELKDFAANTPFEFPEVQAAAKKLLAFNTPAKELKETLRQLGDIASGVDAPIGEIAEVFGKARVQGRLFAEDINQFQGRGIPIVTELAKVIGVSTDEIRKLVEQGKVGFPELQQVFTNLTNEGSRFGGLMAEQSKTIPGLISNLSDAVGQAAARLGASLAEGLDVKGALSGLASTINTIGVSSSDSARAFLNQRDSVAALNSAILPLAERYDQLKGKANLSKGEQEELRTIIERIGKQLPETITQFDAYGKALDISTGKVRELVSQQERALRQANKGELTKQREEFRNLTTDIDAVTAALKRRDAAGNIVGTNVNRDVDNPLDPTEIKLTGDQIAALQARLSALRESRKDVGALIDSLKGLKTAAVETNDTLPLKPVIDEAARKAAEAAAKALEALQKALRDNSNNSRALGADYSYLQGEQSVLESGIKSLISAGFNPAGKTVQGYVARLRELNKVLGDNTYLSSKAAEGLAEFGSNKPKINPLDGSVITPDSGPPKQLSPLPLDTTAATESFTLFTQAQADFNTNVEALVNAFPYDAFSAIGIAIGQSLGQGGDLLDAAGQALLKVLADFGIKYGQQLIALGIADIATGFFVGKGLAEIAAGTGLIAASSALGAGGGGAKASASGGGGSSLGSSPRSNFTPTVAPNGTAAGPAQVTHNVVFQLQGNQLTAALAIETDRIGRIIPR